MFSTDSLTQKKQNGKSLSQNEIEFIVNGYTAGTISDDDMTYWLKAVMQQGMSHKETMDYTNTMLNSGAQLDFSHLPGYVIDKHSTGGVGDKVSLILGPLLAACGFYVPMLSGRGLGHTQGTIDKLESIPGYRAVLNLPTFQQIVEDVGISIMAQSQDICPADHKIYALRDITDTVASFPLICGSIMSKKVAEGIQGLVLDIKIGSGAFMKTLSEAEKLGTLLKDVGKLYGLQISICYTGMEQPLGNTAGLWCEIMESVDCLKVNGPDDVMSVVYHLGEQALILAEISNPEKLLKDAISDGSAFEKFSRMVSAHGGSIESMDNPHILQPSFCKQVLAESVGYITAMNTLELGRAVVQMGGGRLQKNDRLDYTAGIRFYHKVGASINIGDILAEVFCSNEKKLNIGFTMVKNSFRIEYEKPCIRPLIY